MTGTERIRLPFRPNARRGGAALSQFEVRALLKVRNGKLEGFLIYSGPATSKLTWPG
jgi:hypothetical protein